MTKATVSADGETITVHIPLTFRKRGGRKLVVTPDGAEWGAPRPRTDNAMVKALVRAFRWRKLLDEGVHATLEDLATAKGVNATYVSRVLRLTLPVDGIQHVNRHGILPFFQGDRLKARGIPARELL